MLLSSILRKSQPARRRGKYATHYLSLARALNGIRVVACGDRLRRKVTAVAEAVTCPRCLAAMQTITLVEIPQRKGAK